MKGRGDDRRWLDRALRAGWPRLAAFYHFGSTDAPTSPQDTIEAFEASVVRRSRTNPPPSPFKATKGRGMLLPTRPYSGEFAEVLLSRRTWRGFGRRPITKEELGSLLDLTFGYQLHGKAYRGRIVFKTSPSAGARHPVEAYVLVLRVAGLSRGLYHYSPRTGRLYPVRRGATPARAVKYLAGQSWYRNASVLVLMTAVLPRVWWRYPHPRAYRTTLLDAGHLCQTFCLVATWLGLAPFSTMALDDARVEKDLGVDGAREVLLYAAGVGSRPADGRWVQWPEYRPKV